MRENNGSYYARMGIWGEPTGITPTPIKSGIDVAFNTVGNVQKMFGNQYDNIIRKYQAQDAALKNQYTQATQQGSIDAQNTKNQTDVQYYPQMQAAKLAQDQQTVNEIMSRTGLNRASAQEAGARMGLIGAQTGLVNAQTSNTRNEINPGYMYDSVKREMENSPMGSPRRSYFGGILANMMNSSGGPVPMMEGSSKKSKNSMQAPGMGSGSQSSPGGASVPNMPGISVNPMTVSRSSNKGAEYAKTGDDGDTTVYTSPTTPTVTNLQNRLSAESELHSLSPTMNAGIAPYISTYGANVSYPMDLYKSKLGDKNAQVRVDAAESAMQLVREKAILRLRQASPGADIGQEAVNSMVKQMYPNLPAHFMRGFNNAQNIAESTQKVDEQLAKANQVAAQAVASNYPTPVDSPPVWDSSAKAQSGWKFDPSTGGLAAPQPSSSPQNTPDAGQDMPSDSDIAHTAKLYGISKEEVKRRLGLR